MVGTVLFRPVHELMHHDSSGPGGDGGDSSLSNTILMVCTNTTELNLLIQELELVEEFLRSIGVVVSSVFSNTNTMGLGEVFELALRLDGFTSSKSYLMFEMDVPRSMIIEDRAAMVSLFDWFLTIRILAASWDRTYVLIGRHTVAGLEIVRTNHISSFTNFGRLTRSGSTGVLASQHASSTFRMRARTSALLHGSYDCRFAFTKGLLTTVHEGLDPSKSGMT